MADVRRFDLEAPALVEARSTPTLVFGSLPYWLVRSSSPDQLRKYNAGQKRDPNGEWGDGVPGPGMPDLDMEGFGLISEVEGSFGTLQMGVDPSGDVRVAWHEGNDARAVDLGGDDAAELGDILRRLEESRADIPDDAGSLDVVDDGRFGYDNAHKVELLGNGMISITFVAEDDDPYTLNLDPVDPDEDTDDVAEVLSALDDVIAELDG